MDLVALAALAAPTSADPVEVALEQGVVVSREVDEAAARAEVDEVAYTPAARYEPASGTLIDLDKAYLSSADERSFEALYLPYDNWRSLESFYLPYD